MFKILDDNKVFYQWDKNRKLIIEDENIKEVHFCNRTDDIALMCEVYEKDGLRLVDVPNKLLTESWDIKVYASDGDNTRYYDTIKVIERKKPSDYVYEETEVFTYRQLEKRLIEIETAGFKKDVEEYFESHPVAFSVNGQTGEVVLNADDVRAISIDNKASYDDAVTKAHTHSNKTALDKITDSKLTGYDNAVSNTHTHSNKSTLDKITEAKITSWENKSEFDGKYSSLTGIPTDIAKTSYVDSKVAVKANTADLATVATSGSYGDLTHKPYVVGVDCTPEEEISTYFDKDARVEELVSNYIKAYTNVPGCQDKLTDAAIEAYRQEQSDRIDNCMPCQPGEGNVEIKLVFD